jgi:hypothetical protein
LVATGNSSLASTLQDYANAQVKLAQVNNPSGGCKSHVLDPLEIGTDDFKFVQSRREDWENPSTTSTDRPSRVLGDVLSATDLPSVPSHSLDTLVTFSPTADRPLSRRLSLP